VEVDKVHDPDQIILPQFLFQSFIFVTMEQENHEKMKVAVKEDDFLIVSDLLSAGLKPTLFDLIQAVENKSFPILELFLQHGYDINKPLRTDYPSLLSQVYVP
jgi:hypothetical protein